MIGVIILIFFFVFVSFSWGIFGLKTCDPSNALRYIVHTVVYLMTTLLAEKILWKIQNMPLSNSTGISMNVMYGRIFFLGEILFGFSSIMAVFQNLINYYKNTSDKDSSIQ